MPNQDNPEEYPIDNDITEALDNIDALKESASSEFGEEKLKLDDGCLAVDSNQPQNPRDSIAQFFLGLKTGSIKSYRMSRKHPWWTCFGFFGSIASAIFICQYCGVLGVAGMIVYAVKNEKA